MEPDYYWLALEKMAEEGRLQKPDIQRIRPKKERDHMAGYIDCLQRGAFYG